MLRPAERAVVDALCPSNACSELPYGAFDAGFDDFYAKLPETAPASLYWSFKGALLAAIWLSPLMIGKLPPFTRLNQDEREAALEALGRCPIYPIRQCLILLKAVISFCYGGNDKVRKAVGAWSK